jgi:type IV pilus assembly protein PilW
MTTSQRRRLEHNEQGFSLIEIMVGVVIGLIAVLVIYQVFSAAEGIKRNTTSVGDAQQNGLLSSFMLGIELANAGNGVASAARDLEVCPGGDPFASTWTVASTWRPLPLLIVAGLTDDVPDSFSVNYSVTNAAIAPAPFTANATGAVDYKVQSPTGFKIGDLIVAIGGSPAAAGCAASIVTNVSPPDGLGVVAVSHPDPGGGANFASGNAVLLNMGPGNAQKVRYDVTAGILRSTALLKADGTLNDDTTPRPNPVASNVVNMKLQYGVDATGTGVLTWVSAATSPWTPAELTSTIPGANLIAQLKTLKAVRIGIVVQGEQWDKDGPDVPWHLFGGTAGGGYEGTFLRANGNYRYRTYETVIPLRNELWNSL